MVPRRALQTVYNGRLLFDRSAHPAPRQLIEAAVHVETNVGGNIFFVCLQSRGLGSGPDLGPMTQMLENSFQRKNQSLVRVENWESESITLAEEVECIAEDILDDLDGARFQCNSFGIDVMSHPISPGIKPSSPGVLGILLDDELCVIDIVRRSPADDCQAISVGDQLASVDGMSILPKTHTKEQVSG